MLRTLISVFALLLLAACATLVTFPHQDQDVDRLSFFPTKRLPLLGEVSIHWESHSVPFIEAEKDEDVPLALGLVHAHLRSGQLELLRYLSQGRAAELAGTFAVDLDHSFRILDFPRAAQTSIAAMPAATKKWAQRFLQGLNIYFERNTNRIPVDLQALGVDHIPPWTLLDLVTVWKLASLDVNWGIYAQVLMEEDASQRQWLWKTLLEIGAQSTPSITKDQLAMGTLFFHATKTGSNSYVIGKKKTRSGSGMIANDPHLGFTLPSTWLIAGFRSPSYEAIGLMIPSLPAIALGRNREIAWGGTNMWGLSTHLYALSEAELAEAQVQDSKIQVRGWFDKTVTRRFSKHGPVISDMPFFKGKLAPTALRWMGHEASDEVGAFLAANRSRNVEEFRRAFRSYAVSAQNMLVVDRKGNTGHVLAYRQPARPDEQDRSLFQPTSNAWSGYRMPQSLPFVSNPKEGFIASANNLPFSREIMKETPSLGWFYQSSDRIQRLKKVLGDQKSVGVRDLMKLQLDTYSAGAVAIQKAISKLESQLPKALLSKNLWQEFVRWGGYFRKQERGPVAFQTLLSHLAPAVFKASKEIDGDQAQTLLRSSSWKKLFLKQWGRIAEDQKLTLLKEALEKAQEGFTEFANWGEMHRMSVEHPLANVPLIGERYRVLEFGIDGSADTLMKTATRLGAERATSFYGANARHISDLSHPDENYFVLYGGQDGWLFSAHTTDQVDLWRDGKYLKLPLSLEGQKKVFTRTLKLTK